MDGERNKTLEERGGSECAKAQRFDTSWDRDEMWSQLVERFYFAFALEDLHPQTPGPCPVFATAMVVRRQGGVGDFWAIKLHCQEIDLPRFHLCRFIFALMTKPAVSVPAVTGVV